MKIFGRGKNTSASAADDDLDAAVDDAGFDDTGAGLEDSADDGLSAPQRGGAIPRGGSKKTMIMMLLVLLLAGGGFAGLMMMGDDAAMAPPPIAVDAMQPAMPLAPAMQAANPAGMGAPAPLPGDPAAQGIAGQPPVDMLPADDAGMPPMPAVPPMPTAVADAAGVPVDPLAAATPPLDPAAPATGEGVPVVPVPGAAVPVAVPVDPLAAIAAPAPVLTDPAAPIDPMAATDLPAPAPVAEVVDTAVPADPLAPVAPPAAVLPTDPTVPVPAMEDDLDAQADNLIETPSVPGSVPDQPGDGATAAEQAMVQNADMAAADAQKPQGYTPEDIAKLWANLPVEKAMVRPLPKQYLTVKKEKAAESIDSRLATARRALNDGRTAAALQFFNELRTDYPHDTRVLMGRAVTLQRLGQNQDALEGYEDVLVNDPKNLDALTNMLGLIKQQNPQLALDKLQDLRNLYPYNADITTQLAVAYGQTGNLSEALRYITLAEALKPDSGYVLYNKAVLYDRLGRTAEAADMYRVLIRRSAEGSLDQDLPIESLKKRLAVMR